MAKSGGLIKGIKGMAMMSSSVLVDYVVGLVITYVLARLLTQADYGEVAAITVMVGFADLFWQLGVGPAIVQKKDATEEDILTAQTLNFVFGFVVFAVINLFAGFWANVFSIPNIAMLRVYSLVFILNSCIATPMALAQRKCNFKLLSSINVWGVLFYGIIVIVLAKLGFGPWALVYATLLRYVFKLIVLIVNVKIKPGFYFNKYSAKKLLHFGGGETLSRIFNYIANNGDNFVINKTMGKVELGNYTKAYSLLSYPATLIGQSLAQVLFPILSDCQDDVLKLKKSFYAGTGLIALLSVPISLVCYFCAEDLILFYLGEKWISVALPFKIMVAGLFFRTAYKLSDTVIRAMGKVYQGSVVQVVYAVLIVATSYIGHFFGLWAVAFGVTLSFVTNYFMMYFLCSRYIKLNLTDVIKAVFPSLLYGAAAAIMLKVCYSLFICKIGSHFMICVVDTLVAFSVYVTLFVTTRKYTLTKEMNSMVDVVIGSVKRKISHK